MTIDIKRISVPMMKKKIILAVICGMALCLTACGTKDEKEGNHKDATESVIEIDQSSEAEETSETYVTEQVPGIIVEEEESSEDDSNSGRKDGERFEAEIMMEGMTETVGYEHAISQSGVFEIDYEYDSLVRNSGSDDECFISKYDDPEDPMNYLLVKYVSEDAETTLAELNESLKNDFDEVTMEEAELEGAGKCECIITLGVMNKELPAGALKRVYIIPETKGCIIAEANYTIESAEGFGTRFVNMINTLTLLE